MISRYGTKLIDAAYKLAQPLNALLRAEAKTIRTLSQGVPHSDATQVQLALLRVAADIPIHGHFTLLGRDKAPPNDSVLTAEKPQGTCSAPWPQT